MERDNKISYLWRVCEDTMDQRYMNDMYAINDDGPTPLDIAASRYERGNNGKK